MIADPSLLLFLVQGTVWVPPLLAGFFSHPAVVKTDLSKEFWAGVPENKLFTPEYAAERLANVVARLTIDKRGKVWDWKGDEVEP